MKHQWRIWLYYTLVDVMSSILELGKRKRKVRKRHVR